MVAFLVEIGPVLTPGMQVGDEFKLLTAPRVKRMGNLETSTRIVRISRS